MRSRGVLAQLGRLLGRAPCGEVVLRMNPLRPEAGELRPRPSRGAEAD